MAVQQNKKSRSARDMRRSHDALEGNALSRRENAPVKSVTCRSNVAAIAIESTATPPISSCMVPDMDELVENGSTWPEF